MSFTHVHKMEEQIVPWVTSSHQIVHTFLATMILVGLRFLLRNRHMENTEEIMLFVVVAFSFTYRYAGIF